jgi:TonB family protein
MVDSKILTKNRNFYFLALLVLTAFLSPRIAAQSQPATPNVDPAISKLAAKIAEPLRKAGATKVVVADLQGPDGQMHPVGRWLAEQLSISLTHDFPGLGMLVRAPEENATSGNEDFAISPLASAEEKDWGRKLGANVIITGSFAKVPHGIGVSLTATSLAYPVGWRGHTDGLVPITDEVSALSPNPVPSPKGGIARAGVGGTSNPSCTSCPTPMYTDKARKAKYQGVVVLLVTVSAEGRAKNISVVKGPGLGLEENSIEAVKRWKFKPARDTDGNPVDSFVPIEVTFRLY